MCLLRSPAGPTLANQPGPRPAAACPQACSCSAGFRELWDKKLPALRPSLPCRGWQTRCKCSSRLPGLQQSALRCPPALQRCHPTPSCSGSPGELLAGRKQAAEAAGRSKGMHRSFSPAGMLRSTVGVRSACASHPAAISPVSHQRELSRHGALMLRHPSASCLH